MLTEQERIVKWLLAINDDPSNVEHDTDAHSVATAVSLRPRRRWGWTHSAAPFDGSVESICEASRIPSFSTLFPDGGCFARTWSMTFRTPVYTLRIS